jgi:hypothetical protein
MESAEASAQLLFVGRRQLSAVALGGASWSFADYARWLEATPHPVDDDLAIRTIHAALDGGIRLIDTARVYTTTDHPGHSEALIARALGEPSSRKRSARRDQRWSLPGWPRPTDTNRCPSRLLHVAHIDNKLSV